MKWWEKTVEYLFVVTALDINALRREDLIMAPLDGPAEIIGDAVVAVAERWLIIEFKSTRSSILSERTKFSRYAEAERALKGKDGHHWLIYGANIEGKLHLCARTYFSNGGTTGAKDIRSILSTGIPKEDFNAYVKKLTEFKKTTQQSSGGIALVESGLVAGISSDGQIVESKSFAEYVSEHDLDHGSEPSRSFGLSR